MLLVDVIRKVPRFMEMASAFLACNTDLKTAVAFRMRIFFKGFDFTI